MRKSRKDDVLFWLDECETLGEFDSDSKEPVNREWKAARYAVDPSEEDYASAIAAGMGDTLVRERYLRHQLWWAFNDKIRHCLLRRKYAEEDPGLIRPLLVKLHLRRSVHDETAGTLESPLPPPHVENLNRLIAILTEEGESGCVMKADALRHLGRFDEALQCLDADFPPELLPYASKIRALASASNRLVAQIDSVL